MEKFILFSSVESLTLQEYLMMYRLLKENIPNQVSIIL